MNVIKKIDERMKKEYKKLPLYKISRNIVLDEGNSKAKIMLVGQNPGKEEDRLKKPFVGKSGKFLDKILEENKIKRKNLYITSVVKLKTPKNRKPNRDEIDFFMPYLIEKIKIIKPKIVVLMGEIAWKIPKIKGISYIKTYHPAAAMRFPKIRKKFGKDFKKISKLK
jgi:uracil-DNA glycosylase